MVGERIFPELLHISQLRAKVIELGFVTQLVGNHKNTVHSRSLRETAEWGGGVRR